MTNEELEKELAATQVRLNIMGNVVWRMMEILQELSPPSIIDQLADLSKQWIQEVSSSPILKDNNV